jgi:SH3-like domain-containing protein
LCSLIFKKLRFQSSPAGGSSRFRTFAIQVPLTGLADTEWQGGGTSFLSSRWLRSHKARGLLGLSRFFEMVGRIAVTLRFSGSLPFAHVRLASAAVSMQALAALAALSLLILAGAPARAANDATSSLPVPRFVSLKTDRVNVRGGPDKDHDVTFIYTRIGWPVEITAEFENWRRIRDSDGSEGWVYHSMLSGKRMAVVRLKASADLAPLHAKPDAQSTVTARLQSGVLGTVKQCTGTWCRVAGEGFDGWVEQSRLWGVYPDEKID